MDLNKAMIIGNLTRDPETRNTPSGQTVTSFGVATNLVWTNANGEKQTKVEFHNIVAWRKLAEICAQYLKKGNKVYIEGRLQTRDWTTTDGEKRQRTEIVADNMIMLSSRPSGIPQAPINSPAPIQQFSDTLTEETPAPENLNISESNDEVKVEDIPF